MMALFAGNYLGELYNRYLSWQLEGVREIIGESTKNLYSAIDWRKNEGNKATEEEKNSCMLRQRFYSETILRFRGKEGRLVAKLAERGR